MGGAFAACGMTGGPVSGGKSVPGWEESAHSEYIEVAATTGLVGAGLLFAPFLLVVRRLRYVRRSRVGRGPHHLAGFCLALLVTVAVAGFGQVLFSSLAFWSFMPAVWGLAFGAERAAKTDRRIAAMAMGPLRLSVRCHNAAWCREQSAAQHQRAQLATERK